MKIKLHLKLLITTIILNFNQAHAQFEADNGQFNINTLSRQDDEYDLGPAEHLKYFGYYWSHTNENPVDFPENSSQGIRQNSPLLEGYIGEYADHTNLSWVVYQGTQETISLIEQAAQQGQKYGREHKVVVDVSAITYFDPSTEETRKKGIHLVENLEGANGVRERIRNFWSDMKSANVDQHIVMIYPLDEPYLNLDKGRPKTIVDKITHFFKKIIGDPLSKRTKPIYEHMVKINTIVKEEIKDRVNNSLPLGVFLHSSYSQEKRARIPENYDWIGISCYSTLNNCGGEGHTLHKHFSIIEKKIYKALERKAYPHQRFMFAAESWHYTSDGLKTVSANELNRRLKQAYITMLAEPRFIALIPFIWRSYGNDSNKKYYRGARQITDHRQALKIIGQQIVTGAKIMPETTFYNNHIPIGDVTIFDTENKRIYGWAYDKDVPVMPPIIHVEIDGVVKNMGLGQLSHTDTNVRLESLGRHTFYFDVPPQQDQKWHLIQITALNNKDSGKHVNTHRKLKAFAYRYKNSKLEFSDLTKNFYKLCSAEGNCPAKIDAVLAKSSSTNLPADLPIDLSFYPSAHIDAMEASENGIFKTQINTNRISIFNLSPALTNSFINKIKNMTVANNLKVTEELDDDELTFVDASYTSVHQRVVYVSRNTNNDFSILETSAGDGVSYEYLTSHDSPSLKPSTDCMYSADHGGTADDDILCGTNSSDLMYGYSGTDILNGYDGDDILHPGSGYNDQCNGGFGVDTCVIAHTADSCKFEIKNIYRGDIKIICESKVDNSLTSRENEPTQEVKLLLQIEKIQFIDFTFVIDKRHPEFGVWLPTVK